MLSFRPLHFVATGAGPRVKLKRGEIKETDDDEKEAMCRCGDLAAIFREIRNLSRG